MNKELVLAMDLGGTNLRMASVNSSGEILYRIKRATPSDKGVSGIVQAITDLANECRQSSTSPKSVFAIAAAVPGTVNVEKGIIRKSPNIPALDNFPLTKILETKLNLKCFLENDANAAAIGECWLGASKKLQSSIYITLGTGVGGGIIIDGKVLRGIDGTAAEIGHICVEPFGAPCGCGSRGCLEQYCSATAVVRLTGEIAPEYPKSVLIKNKSLTAFDTYNAGKTGDALALEVFRRQGFYLGIGLAGLINVLNPEAIVIGGGAAAGWDLFVPEMVKQIRLRSYREPAERARIIRAEWGDDAGILGAARIAFENLLNR
jgi:glucokinase